MYYKIINKKKLLITKVGDRLGQIIFPPALLHGKDKDIHFAGIRKILIIRTAYIGDVVLTLPVLRPLRALFPQAKISFLCPSNAREVVEKNPYLDEVIPYDAFWFYGHKTAGSSFLDYIRVLRRIRSGAYDLVIEARGDIRDIFLLAYLSNSTYRISYAVGGGGFLLTHTVPFKEIKHKVQYHLDIVKFLGGKIDPVEWDLYLTEDENRMVSELLKKKEIPPNSALVGIHPGARKTLKRWSISGFAAVADRLVEDLGVSIILMGGLGDVELTTEVKKNMKHAAFDVAGEISLRQMAAMLKRCRLFICNDSAPLHMASLTKTPTVAIFGPSKSLETGPYGNVHAVVENSFACRYGCDENFCEYRPHKDCLDSITSDMVFQAACHIYSCAVNRGQ